MDETAYQLGLPPTDPVLIGVHVRPAWSPGKTSLRIPRAPRTFFMCSVSVDWTLLQHFKDPVLHCELSLEVEGLAEAVLTRATARMMRVAKNCMAENVKES